ncbi:uncharacterized protein DUF262 [Ectopseudomonas oleovorans]|uniref:Uncharacterized protein DUF262 n=1 Tax=Ectopseudomonas oleovorans TaxID=301 RepID=A0A397M1J4_ECTOL|nr:DUF262 domain-containing protein [Pseudomonas oleovorans]RIA18850.1 uncharacterized protein DUF262 [Pseudomonas oleovorans]
MTNNQIEMKLDMSDEREEDWNEELADEVSSEGVESLVVYSRDWTVETILKQIEHGNIDLSPGFQRRNAWNDIKRSKLIESLIIGVPVPEIVLAEDLAKKKSFIVIDGKQRLLALAGYAAPDEFDSWDKAALKGLNTRKDLNGLPFGEIEKRDQEHRLLMNSDIRCTVIANYKSNDVLYDIFYRLNTGSVPLSSQELRQVLNRGKFAEYLIGATNNLLPIHEAMNLKGPDNRLRDAEIVLRYIAFSKYGMEYGGNLTPFLDESMAKINEGWGTEEADVVRLFDEMNEGCAYLLDKVGLKKTGRKFTEDHWETRFNRALFEVECYYFSKVPKVERDAISAADLIGELEHFFKESPDFVDSIETSTKNIYRYRARYALFQEFVNKVFGTAIDCVPLPEMP